MADGDHTLRVTLKLSEQAVRHLREGAARLGMSVEDYASDVIEQRLFEYEDYDWGGDDPRGALAEPAAADEPTYSAEETFQSFREALEQRLASKE